MSSPVWNRRRARQRARRLDEGQPVSLADLDTSPAALAALTGMSTRWPFVEEDPLDGLLGGRPLYRDRAGRPITARQWVEGRADDHRVARETVATPSGTTYDVSTVHLGLDHGWGRGPVLIFESLVFGAEGDSWSGFMLRYGTETASWAGHRSIVWAITHGREPDDVDEGEP